jgi:hypothetical protein
MKILNLYAVQPVDLSKIFEEEDTIVQEQILNLANIEGKFDRVLCRHSLSLLEPETIPTTFDKLASLVDDWGELLIITPALEYFAAQCYSDAPAPVFHQVVFGSKQAHNRCGFTLAWLRNLVETCNLQILRASQQKWEIPYMDTTIPVLENVVVGKKFVYPEKPDVA